MQKFISMSLKLTLIICWTTVPIPISSLRSVSCHSYTKTCVYVVRLCACTCCSTCTIVYFYLTCHCCQLFSHMSPLSTFACFYLLCPRDVMPGFILSTTSVVFGFCLCLCLREAFYILKCMLAVLLTLMRLELKQYSNTTYCLC